MTPSALWLLLVLVGALAAAEDRCQGPLVEVAVSRPGDKRPLLVYGVLASFGSNLSAALGPGLPLSAAVPEEACSNTLPAATGEATHSAGGSALCRVGAFGQAPPHHHPSPHPTLPLGTGAGAVLVRRGNCSFADKAMHVQGVGGAAMLLYNSQPGCVTPGFDPNTTAGVRIPVVSLPQAAGLQLLQGVAALEGTTVSLSLIKLPKFDPSELVLWALAVLTLVVGSLWSGADHAAARLAAQRQVQRAGEGGEGGAVRSDRLSPKPCAWWSVGGEAAISEVGSAAWGVLSPGSPGGGEAKGARHPPPICCLSTPGCMRRHPAPHLLQVPPPQPSTR